MPKKDSRLIIYEKMCNLIFYSRNLMIKFPKSERFAMCEEIREEELDVIRDVMYAWKEKDNKIRTQYLMRADVEIYVLKTFARLAFKSKYISDQNYKAWNDQLTEVGKMIGGWLNTCQRG